MESNWLSELVHFLEPEDAALWLAEPNPHLHGRTPLEAVRDGDQDDVAEAVEALME